MPYSKISIVLGVALTEEEVAEIPALNDREVKHGKPLGHLEYDHGTVVLHRCPCGGALAWPSEPEKSDAPAPTKAEQHSHKSKHRHRLASRSPDGARSKVPKHYVLGVALHTYYNCLVSCPECATTFCTDGKVRLAIRCSHCNGMTNNGSYDVDAIGRVPTEVNLRHVCLYCFADNRRDLGGLKTNALVDRKGYPIYEEPPAFQKCTTCGRWPDRSWTPETHLRQTYCHQDLLSFIAKLDSDKGFGAAVKNKPLRFYYVINGCPHEFYHRLTGVSV